MARACNGVPVRILISPLRTIEGSTLLTICANWFSIKHQTSLINYRDRYHLFQPLVDLSQRFLVVLRFALHIHVIML